GNSGHSELGIVGKKCHPFDQQQPKHPEVKRDRAEVNKSGSANVAGKLCSHQRSLGSGNANADMSAHQRSLLPYNRPTQG
ncbi:unnamed protein product, partial [Ectocarpus sp. 4 AP-2014]